MLNNSALYLTTFLFCLFSFGCQTSPTNTVANATTANTGAGTDETASTDSSSNISTFGGPDENVSEDEIEKGRNDQGWKQYVAIETDNSSGQTTNNEKLEDIDPESVNSGKMNLPLGSGEGPSVLRAQILLDRSPFSPGIVDGLWGKNTEKAVYWLQKSNNLRATGKINEETFKKLFDLSGAPDNFIIEHKLTEKDVSGPFVEIPGDIYAKAELDCLCYESLEEKLSEMFHTSPDLLAQLNPKADLDGLKAGDAIMVPNVTDTDLEKKSETAKGPEIAKIVISGGGHYLHALDESDNVIYHFPTTLGSDYAPSPSGEWKINAIAWDPTWHYQPSILTGEPDDKPNAIIPAGPNNPVGKVWMDLSKEHYGIHGTKAPETIGYATSNGCVRLTNWDAVFLANRVNKGVAVRFTDTEDRKEQSAAKRKS